MLKGAGLIVAIAAGVCAGLLHSTAISRVRSEVEAEARMPLSRYLAVAHSYDVGERIGAPGGRSMLPSKDVFIAVSIPENVRVPLIPTADRDLVLGKRITRSLAPGDVLFQQDLAEAESDLEIEGDERAIFVSLTGVRFELSILKVGRRIGFVIDSAALPIDDSVDADGLRELGPFRILSIGSEVAIDAQGQSPTITVAAEVIDSDGRLDPNSTTLLDAEQAGAIRALTLWPRDE